MRQSWKSLSEGWIGVRQRICAVCVWEADVYGQQYKQFGEQHEQVLKSWERVFKKLKGQNGHSTVSEDKQNMRWEWRGWHERTISTSRRQGLVGHTEGLSHIISSISLKDNIGYNMNIALDWGNEMEEDRHCKETI